MKITYFNRPLAISEDNLLNRDLMVEELAGELEIYFPFQARSLDNRLSREQILERINTPSAKRPYRVCFSPVTVLITPTTKQMPDFLADHVDICIGQESVKRMPRANYFRLPAWCLRLFGLFPSLEQIQAKIDELEALRKANPFARKEYMACLTNKDNRFFAKGSLDIFTMIHDIDPYLKHLPIKFAGNYAHNDDRLAQVYQGDKLAYLQNFTFHLCPEQINLHSVVSENLALALEAGCIPVYWGDLAEDKQYFNEKAMIIYDVTRRSEISTLFREVFLKQQEFIQENIFLPQAANLIYRHIYAPIIAKLELDLNMDLLAKIRSTEQKYRLKNFAQSMHPEAWVTFIENANTYIEQVKK